MKTSGFYFYYKIFSMEWRLDELPRYHFIKLMNVNASNLFKSTCFWSFFARGEVMHNTGADHFVAVVLLGNSLLWGHLPSKSLRRSGGIPCIVWWTFHKINICIEASSFSFHSIRKNSCLSIDEVFVKSAVHWILCFSNYLENCMGGRLISLTSLEDIQFFSNNKKLAFCSHLLSMTTSRNSRPCQPCFLLFFTGNSVIWKVF